MISISQGQMCLLKVSPAANNEFDTDLMAGDGASFAKQLAIELSAENDETKDIKVDTGELAEGAEVLPNETLDEIIEESVIEELVGDVNGQTIADDSGKLLPTDTPEMFGNHDMRDWVALTSLIEQAKGQQSTSSVSESVDQNVTLLLKTNESLDTDGLLFNTESNEQNVEEPVIEPVQTINPMLTAAINEQQQLKQSKTFEAIESNDPQLTTDVLTSTKAVKTFSQVSDPVQVQVSAIDNTDVNAVVTAHQGFDQKLAQETSEPTQGLSHLNNVLLTPTGTTTEMSLASESHSLMTVGVNTQLETTSVDAAVKTAEATVALQSDNWGESLAEKCVFFVKEGVTEAKIQLDPPHLGSLNVQLHLHDNQAQVVFVSAHAEVRELLKDAIADLQNGFSQEGIELTQANVQDFSQGNHHTHGQQTDKTYASSSLSSDTMHQSNQTTVSQIAVRSDGLIDDYA